MLGFPFLSIDFIALTAHGFDNRSFGNSSNFAAQIADVNVGFVIALFRQVIITVPNSCDSTAISI